MKGYFDYNATAPLRPEAAGRFAEVLAADVGNPSSMHQWGRRASDILDQARHSLATALGVAARTVVFTSGATESNNLAIRGTLAANPTMGTVTTTIEHASILKTLEALEETGTPVARLAVDANGLFDMEELGDLCSRGPQLLSMGWANGESGHLADVQGAAACVTAAATDSILHVDAAQAFGRVPVSVPEGVDLLSVSAHKFGGPTGVGALVVARDDIIESVTNGGSQEGGLRAGTENLAAIAAMAAAAEAATADLEKEGRRLVALREELWALLEARLNGIVRVSPADGLPNTLSIALEHPHQDVSVAGLDLAGYAVSTGAACAAASPEPSHVIDGLGLALNYRRGVVRISMGHATTADEVEGLAAAFVAVVQRARRAA
ncbi:MAG: cysteine desulfurase family protein [Deltaproteobacteria bacterium]